MKMLNKQARVLWTLSQQAKEKGMWELWKDKPLYEVMRASGLIEEC